MTMTIEYFMQLKYCYRYHQSNNCFKTITMDIAISGKKFKKKFIFLKNSYKSLIRI